MTIDNVIILALVGAGYSFSELSAVYEPGPKIKVKKEVGVCFQVKPQKNCNKPPQKYIFMLTRSINFV